MGGANRPIEDIQMHRLGFKVADLRIPVRCWTSTEFHSLYCPILLRKSGIATTLLAEGPSRNLLSAVFNYLPTALR